jgi:hypothetical protein
MAALKPLILGDSAVSWIVPDVCQSPTEHKRSRVASTQSIEFSRHIVSWFIWIEVGKIVGKIVGAWAGTLKHGK